MVAAEGPAPALPTTGLVVVTGPSRSGKSRWAEHLAETSGRPVLYVATGPDRPGDSSWRLRLQRHRRRRPAGWQTLEAGANWPPNCGSCRATPTRPSRPFC